MSLSRSILPLAIAPTLTALASALPQVQNPANGHYYEYVPGQISWTQARAAAEQSTFMGAQGHLATISTEQENSFVFSIAPDDCWLGGFQDTSSPSYSEPGGGWTWVTGEPFSYTRWAPGEPNDTFGTANFLELWDIGRWDDTSNNSFVNNGYIIEYEVPTLNPANGNYYLYVSNSLTWTEARAAAEQVSFMGVQGHLATISDASEGSFVRGIDPSFHGGWLGGFQDTSAPGYSEPGGGWAWVTGEPFSYTNWRTSTGEPNNGSALGEDSLEMTDTGDWNDAADTASIFNPGYVVEFDVAIGTTYCTSQPNSTGAPGVLAALGSRVAAANDFTIAASSMPPLQFASGVVSLTQSNVTVGSGTLCLGGTIGRFNAPSQVMQVDPFGQCSLQVDTTFIPQSGFPVTIQSGETWNFQIWYRDFLNGAPTSNFTSAVEVTFL